VTKEFIDISVRIARSFSAGRSRAYSGLQCVGRQQAQCACPWERWGELVGVCATCGRGGISRREQLVRYLLTCPVKAWLTVWLAWLELMQRQPPALMQCWPRQTLMQRSQRLVTSFCLGHVGTADILTLLIKMPATVRDFRGHRRTLYYLPGIISLIIMCIGIITK